VGRGLGRTTRRRSHAKPCCAAWTTAVLHSMSTLASLTSLDISCCDNVNVMVLRSMSSLTALTSLEI